MAAACHNHDAMDTEEDESDFSPLASDVSDEEDPDFTLALETDTEDSSDETSEEENEVQTNASNRMSKKGSYWSESPPTQGRIPRHNILHGRPGPAPGLTATICPKDAWELFMTENIIQEVMKCTNLEGRRMATAQGKEWKNVEREEFLAFIGLVLLAGVEKNWDVPIRELFVGFMHNPMYRATMSVRRFEEIRRTLRFDDRRTREFRLATDHMAAFRYIWDLFLVNCRQRFIPNDCVTVDEQLIPFRGRCKFVQYMPSKPAKYGLKVFWVCDARVPYAIDGHMYTGRQPGEDVQKNLGENMVKKLCGGLRNTGRNVTMDNYFTTVPLAKDLLENGLTIVGTLRQNKPDIPPVMKPSKSRELYSTEFGFNESITMVSYVGKKGKAVTLLSTMHHDKVVEEDTPKKKPEMITFYNKSKGGVDTMDQMLRTYSSKRQTRRWPMVLWYNTLDVAALNAYTVFIAQHPEYTRGITHARRLFLVELSQDLVLPYMRRRLQDGVLRTPTIEAMARCGVKKATAQLQECTPAPAKKQRCLICPRNQDRKTKEKCWKCNKAVCRDHSRKQILCHNCCI